MNIYRVHMASEKGESETWITEGSAPLPAIRRAVRGTAHQRATRLSVSATLVEKNMTYRQWKEKDAIKELGF